jgi:hypothetical protein
MTIDEFWEGKRYISRGSEEGNDTECGADEWQANSYRREAKRRDVNSIEKHFY